MATLGGLINNTNITDELMIVLTVKLRILIIDFWCNTGDSNNNKYDIVFQLAGKRHSQRLQNKSY